MESKKCKTCDKTKIAEDFEKFSKRCKQCCYCASCNLEIDRGNVCKKCTRKCVKCKNIKTKEHFSSLSVKKCIDCCNNLSCNKCNVKITDENKSSRDTMCNDCINEKNRTYNKKKSLENSERICCECGIIKNLRMFRSASHKKCSDCYKTRKTITKKEYDLAHPNETRQCIVCNIVKSNKNFKYHTNNYRNQCAECCNYVNSRNYTRYKNTKIDTQEFTDEEFRNFIENLKKKECFYCGNTSKNGVDRMDSDYNYSESNCVSCCSVCNIMKKDMDVGSFIRKCCEIYDYNFHLSEDLERLSYHKNRKLSNKTNPSFYKYMSNAENRNIKFLLQKQEFDDILSYDCYYCGKDSKGIDRRDNNIGYEIDNCVACCKYCNHIKKELDYDVLLEHISKIEQHTRNNKEVNLKAKTSIYRELFAKNVIKIDKSEIEDEIEVIYTISDYFLGIIDCCTSIGSCDSYISICINNEDKDLLNKVNKCFGNMFIMRNSILYLKDNKNATVFLNSYNSASKRDHINIAHKILKERDKQKRKNLCEELRVLNSSKKLNYDTRILSIEYVAGVFECKGKIQFCNKNIVLYVYHPDIDVIISIMNMYQNCYISLDRICIYSKEDQITFLESIYSHLTNKKEQVKRALEFLNKETDDISIIKLYKNTTVVKFQKIIKNLMNFTVEELLLYNKYKEIKNLEPNIELNKNIYTNFQDISNIKPKLIFCDSQEEHNLWTYYRNKTSSICYSGCVGRSVRILVIDETSKQYIGVMCISSDIYQMSVRDNYIKSFHIGTEVKDYINYIGNLSTCVPLQPFGSNCNGGKLLVKLAFTKEVFEYWYNKYKEPILAINTLSINGKSIQYDRLKELKYLDKTKGSSAYHIPEEIMTIASNLCKKLCINPTRFGKMEKLNALLSHLKIDKKILQHDIQKGIYFGWMFSSKLEMDYNLDELKSVEQMTGEWYTRWCVNRIAKMKEDGRFTTELSLYSRDSPQFDEVKNLNII
jgi:hypothetical protein